jgi:hypothetical protein
MIYELPKKQFSLITDNKCQLKPGNFRHAPIRVVHGFCMKKNAPVYNKRTNKDIKIKGFVKFNIH